MKMTLLELVQDIPKSTAWARANKSKVKARDDARKSTIEGKLISLITQSRYRSKTSGLDHEINTEYLRGLYHGQNGQCALSGIPMTIRAKRGSDGFWKSVSIDRIDSNSGYVIGNVQLTCTGVNLMKKDMPNELFINFCKAVSEKYT